MNEKTIYHATIVYLVKNTKKDGSAINLPVKKRNIGAGFRNGYGGGIEQEETPAVCAVREILEEGKVKTWPEDLRPIALLRCHNRPEAGEKFLCVVYVFKTSFWLGLTEPKETDEMGPPTWFPIGELPIAQLMPADKIWLPRLLIDQKPLVVTAHYGSHQQTLEDEVVIEEVDTLPKE